MDSLAGKTFLNYLYSWGAAIVILGALFKLTHIPGANLMLFIGMGTEVVVFFFFAFDRSYEVVDDGVAAAKRIESGESEGESDAISDAHQEGESAPVMAGGGYSIASAGGSGPVIMGGGVSGGSGATGSGPVIIGGGGSAIGSGPVIIGGGGAIGGGNATGSGPVIIGGGGVSGDTVAATGGEGVSGPVVIGGGGVTTAGLEPQQIETVTQEYIDKIKELTDALQHVSDQSSALERNMEEMEQLGRNLTGINTIYEMQLRSVSAQVGNLDAVNEQTRRMAQQIEELNSVYARMLEAMTVNMNLNQNIK